MKIYSPQITGSLEVAGNTVITGSITYRDNNVVRSITSTGIGTGGNNAGVVYTIIGGSATGAGVVITGDGAGIDNSIKVIKGTGAIIEGNTQVTGSLIVSGSSTFQQATVLSGSIRGEVNALSISSNTASLNCALDNFFTLQLVSGSNTFINPSNILPGQTINLRINTTGSATVSFPSSVLQVSGSSYVPTTTTGVDVVTFISFDSTSLLLSNVKNLI
jgi:hypothetical protein